MIYLIIGILIIAALFIWIDITERRNEKWEKEK